METKSNGTFKKENFIAIHWIPFMTNHSEAVTSNKILGNMASSATSHQMRH